MATAVGERLGAIWHERPGVAGIITTVDHKKIGLRYLYTGLAFFVVGGLQAAVIRTQLADAELELVDPETFNQLFSMHGIVMMFLFAMPVLSGFGNYFVPLMIGARDMAFPRLNAFSYWVFITSGIFIFSSFLIGHAPNAGWFNYPPLSGAEYAPGPNIDFYALGLIFLGISSTVGAINFIVTIFKLRAPGMSLNRIPIFVWGELAMAFQIIFALPALTLANIMLELERNFGFHFFAPEGGGDPLLWQHLFWIFGHPEVYIIALPAFGIASAIIPTWSRRRIVGYTYIVVAELAVALIGFGVWVHHMFATGIPSITLSFISLASFMIAIPSGVQVFAWIATMRSGRPKLDTPLLFVIGFIFTFVIGGVTGVMFAAIPFDQQVHDTYFVVAHLHYVLVGGATFPMIAALYHWGPKMTGRLLNERLGKWSFWLIFIGFNASMFPLHISGLLGQPRRIYTYQEGMGWEPYNLISTVGTYILGIGVAITLYNWFHSRKHGKPAGNDPFKGETLEWATTSPPPQHNFDHIPTVRSREPVWDQPELRDGMQPEEKGGHPLTGGHITASTSLLDAKPQAIVHMPHGSPWPFYLALALTVLFTGMLLSSVAVIGLGAVGCGVGICGWFWPRGETQET